MKRAFLFAVCLLVSCAEDPQQRHLPDAETQPTTVELTVMKDGTGSGTVTSSPAGISCGATCTASFTQATTVTLTAEAAADSKFTGWNGACSGESTTCEVTLADAASVTASFTLLTHTVTLTKMGPGTGAIQGDGVDCADDCTITVDHGTMLSLTGEPTGLSVFAGWGGACTASSGPCAVTVESDITITANFALDNFSLFAVKAGNGTGTVTSTPAGISCGAMCSHSFTANQMVTLTAAPGTGSSFGGWSGGGCTGTGPCQVTIDGSKTVTATFTKNSYALTITKSGNGLITSEPAGIDCGSTCSASYLYNTMVTLTATPDTGAFFVGWGGTNGACTTTGPCTVTINAAKTITATFGVNMYLLHVDKVGNGTVTSNVAGISCGATCDAQYAYSTMVTLTPAPATGYSFTGWSGACTGPTCTVTMDAAKSVTATFTKNNYALTVNKSGSGTVTSSPSGISCGANCTASFPYQTDVTLTATPATGYSFTGFSGACTGTTCTVTMTAAKSVTATFTKINYPLTVTKSGLGTVTSSPSGINCGSTCSGSFPYQTDVTLTATPATGYMFTGFSGACTGPTCTVTVDAAKSVTATFTKINYPLMITKSGSGTVTSSPSGISCGPTCMASFPYQTNVTLTAAAATGYTFTGFSGACTGTTCTVTMDAAKSVTATFTKINYPLTVNFSGSGTVTSNPTGINCTANCSASFPYQTDVTLTPTPATGYMFTGFSGACTGPSCTVTVDQAKSVTATFTKINYALTVDKTGSGTVTSSPAGISCGAMCMASFAYQTNVTLTATPASGYTFSGFTGACNGMSCTVSMLGARSVTANFTPVYTLTVSKTGDGFGTVTGGSINCGSGAGCVQTALAGTTITLTATPDAADATQSTFLGWSGANCNGNTCTVTLNSDLTVGAMFKLDPNIMFITSKTFTGDLNGVAGADGICTSLAHSAGLSGNYRAYLSYRTTPNAVVNAPERFLDATGWVRPDGKAVMNTIDQMHKGALINPPRIMENKEDITTSQTNPFAWTGTNNDGMHGGNYGECEPVGAFAPWAGTGTSSFFGIATYTTSTVVRSDGTPCTQQAHLYCLGIDRKATVQ